MDSDTIIEKLNGNVKIITFNKPHRKNAIDSNMYARITRILNEAAKDEHIAIVVLTGMKDFYSSGNDQVAISQCEDYIIFFNILRDFIKAFILFPKLLVAIVNGPAVGVAVTTLPLCDFVIASDKAFFYTPFTKLGLSPEGCSTITFPRLIGIRKATELLVLNYKMLAQEALQCGLVNYVYKSEELEEKAWIKINELLKLPGESLLATKRLFRRPHLEELLKANDIEIGEIVKIHTNFQSKL